MVRVRNSLKLTILLIGLVLVLEFPIGISAQEYEPPHDRPGPAADRIQFKSFHVDLAAASVQAGDMDMYVFSLKTEAARKLRDDPNLRVYQAPATMISLILNPAPAPEGELNPFSLRDVRFALQYAVNRRFIAQEIYKGLAEPMPVQVGIFDFDYLTVYEQIKELDITYDPEFAREQVSKAMTEAGAELVDGKWHFNGRPIQLKFIIRVEDERREVGDLIRAELDDLGFNIAPVYHNFAAAIRFVYGSDPQQFEWHLYTEGWGRGSAERYDYGTINSMAAPWLGNMPGWQEVGFWQYENERLDTIGQELFRGDFTSLEERNELYKEMTSLSLDESVRIWLVTIVNSLPTVNGLQGVTEDIVAGPKSIWTLREAYIPGKDTLVVGNLWVWTERSVWNPVGGFGDVYSNDIWQNVFDPTLWRDPFTGIPVPFRATYEVETAGPTGRLTLPSDAFLWDAEKGVFATVEAGTQAISKVTYDYSKFFQSNWHHGQPITMADAIYSLFQTFDMVYNDDKARIEFANSVTSRPFLDTVRGFRIVGDDRLEVYVDYWHFVDDYIAEYANIPSLTTPWEVRVAMDQLVFQDGRAAYSDTAAQRFSVTWLSLVMPTDTRLVRRVLLNLEDTGAFPAAAFQVGDTSLVSREEALARYQAALEWISTYNMAVISNGPYKLVRFDPPAQFAELEAFRDPTYPFKPGDWYRGSAPTIRFGAVETAGIGIGFPVTINVEVQGPGQLGVRYILVDPVTGSKVTSGDAQAVSPTQYTIQLPAEATAAIRPGLYDLFITAFSDEVSSLAERKITIEATTGEVSPVATPTPVQPSEPAPQVTATPRPTSEGRSSRSCSGPPLSIPIR
ncbi:MAG: ABC transporter substrate-binding protein [Chloroflexi bacterium]|nr:ABC transporter substrate-binding protein [Chloroflexota bacterium]